MEAYPDDVGEAKISDDNCLCNGGSLEYFNAGPPHIGTQHIRLKIHLSKGIGLDGEDIIYSQVFAPYELGELPFNAYMPNLISESSASIPPIHLSSLNMAYVKTTVESIFSKNGINFSSLSLQKPTQPYKEFDIYNGLVYHAEAYRNGKKPGFSMRLYFTTPTSYDLETNPIEFDYFDENFYLFSNNNHMNYAIGNHFAHELLHQMISLSLAYFGQFGLLYSSQSLMEPNLSVFYNPAADAGHTNNQLNLLLEGSHFNSTNINTCDFITNDQKAKLQKYTGWAGQVKILFPNQVLASLQPMEQIPPGHKTLFTCFKIMKSLSETYPVKSSPEIICGSKILVNTIKMMKLNMYEGF
jgi:hypothetical protein